MFTSEQREWVTTFMSHVKAGMGDPDAEPAEGEDAGFDEIDILIDMAEGGADGEDGGKQGRGGKRNGHAARDDLIDIPDLGDVTDMSCTCTFHNGTKELLTVVQDSLDIDDGKLTTLPDAEVEPGKDTRWVAENTKIPIPIPGLGNVGPFGTEGHIKYTFPDGETTVTLHFNNPRLENGGKNQADAKVEGPGAANFKATGIAGSGNEAKFKFTVTGPGGDKPVPPVPGGDTQQATSCLITVTNQTEATLMLDDQQNEVGDFMTNPASSIAPGGSAQFVYVGTPHGTEPGCRGHCIYIIGEPQQGTWRMDWSNPVGEKNTVTAVADSTTAQFRSLEQIGQGEENVPVAFTLSGGGGGDKPVPPGKEDPPFEPPAASAKEPTLRKGDKAPDGWVEYLQEALSIHGETVTVDGSFGASTLKAVLSFQKKNGLQVDGTVGNQTWAALRKGAPQPPSTDGRTPHTYKEQGVEARFFTEGGDAVFYDTARDELSFTVVSVGDPAAIAGRPVMARITPPGGKVRTSQLPLDQGTPIGPTDQGALFVASLAAMRQSMPSNPPGAPGNAYVIEAYLEAELGGDKWSGNPIAG